MARTSDETGGLTPGGRFITDCFVAFGALTVFLSAIYFVWQMPHLLAGGALVVCLGWIVYRAFILRPFAFRRPDTAGAGLGYVALFTDAIILFALISARTSASIISPWDVVHPAAFVLFGLASAYALLAVRKLGWGWGGLLAVVHLVVTFSVSAIVFGIGFGYDPFVHEATAAYIFSHGSILPKQPFYIGQYVLIIALQGITRLGIHAIQTWIVPFVAPVAILGAAYVRSRRTRGKIAAVLAAVLLMMYAPFTFTVPYNFALALFIPIVLLFEMMDLREIRFAVWALALAIICIHPLIGIPALCLAFVGTLRLKGIRGTLAGLATTFVSLTSALIVYAVRNGGAIALPDPGSIDALIHAFVSPIFIPSLGHPFWSALYALYYLWPLVLFAAGSVFLLRDRERRRGSLALFGSAFGCLLASVIVAVFVRFKDIISYEQLEFSLRLVSIVPWFVFAGVVGRIEGMIGRRGAVWIIAVGAISLWYVAYPQFNPVFNVYSPGVGIADVHSVEEIERLSGGKPYVALVPQMTSAVALQRIGFERSISTRDGNIYPYAIPTGGTLYGYYFSIYYGGDSLAAIVEAAAFAHVDTVFMTVPWAWDPWGHIHERLQADAATVEWVDDRWLFLFHVSSTTPVLP